jgi:hypothetical protein
MSQRQDAMSRAQRQHRRDANTPVATLRSHQGGRTPPVGRQPGYYVPPTIDIPEDTTQAAPININDLAEASAFRALGNLSDVQAAAALDGLAEYALRPPRRQGSITSEVSDPWSVVPSLPQADEAPLIAENVNWPAVISEPMRRPRVALQPIIEEPLPVVRPTVTIPTPGNILSHSIAPLETCPPSTSSTGLMLHPPCVFVSEFGQRIHLYNDGRCLNNVNIRAGVRNLKALPVCLICQARYKAAGAASSSG